MFENIFLAEDGSEHGQIAARAGGEIARLHAAELCIVGAYEPVPKYLGEPNLQEVLTSRLKQSEKIYEGEINEIGEIPWGVKKETLEGPATEAILAVANLCDVDLIIMGTRGLGRFTSALLGRQSQKVIGQASCPVLLIRKVQKSSRSATI
jgi:nucleotide-binding universal stress UspA family protein